MPKKVPLKMRTVLIDVVWRENKETTVDDICAEIFEAVKDRDTFICGVPYTIGPDEPPEVRSEE